MVLQSHVETQHPKFLCLRSGASTLDNRRLEALRTKPLLNLPTEGLGFRVDCRTQTF